MAQISASFYTLSENSRVVTLPVGERLDRLMPSLLHDAVRDDEVLPVVSYRVDSRDSALYELGVRTGDLLTLVLQDKAMAAPMGGDQVSVVVNLFHPSGDIIEVSDNATVGDILSRLARPEHHPALYIGRYTTNVEAAVEDFGLRNGDMVSLAVLPTQIDYTLLLMPARGKFAPLRITESPAVMGRSHGDTEVALDIAHILPRRKRHLIQGAQAEFVKVNDIWHIQALPSANAPVFLDSQRMFPYRPKSLMENAVISLGSSPNEPLAQFVVQFDIENR